MQHSIDWSLFDKLFSDLSASAEALKRLNNDGLGGPIRFDESDSNDTSTALNKIYDILSCLQALVIEPSGFIQRLAIQTQLLASIKWLGEFQVTPCIPLDSSISIQELADLADVPKAVLSRIVRITATAGFLREQEPGYVTHTALSTAFCSQLTYSDAATFLSEVIAPAALRLSSATAVFERGAYRDDTKIGFAITHELGRPFTWACAENPQLRRQCVAYFRTLSRTTECDELDFLTEYLKPLNEGARVVYICDRLTEPSRVFLEALETCHSVVQSYDLAPGDIYTEASTKVDLHDLTRRKITVQRRDPNGPQLVRDAALYILQPFLPSINPYGMNLSAVLGADLQVHLSVLRANPSATLIFLPRLLPESGSIGAGPEAQQRLNDLTNIELGYQGMLEVREAIELVESVHDEHGKLIVTEYLRYRNGAIAGFEVVLRKFEYYLVVLSECPFQNDTRKDCVDAFADGCTPFMLTGTQPSLWRELLQMRFLQYRGSSQELLRTAVTLVETWKWLGEAVGKESS